MERILARLLFSALKDNPQGRDTLVKLLQFYRDNRELIALLLQMQGGAAQPAACPAPPEAPPPAAEAKQNRPHETVGSVSILEEYLKRAV